MHLNIQLCNNALVAYALQQSWNRSIPVLFIFIIAQSRVPYLAQCNLCFPPVWNYDLIFSCGQQLCTNLEWRQRNNCHFDGEKIATITNWLTDSGLKVNGNKTELCLFYHKDTPPIEIMINNVWIKSNNEMNVSGMMFGLKLTWSVHIPRQINKANKALHAIR